MDFIIECWTHFVLGIIKRSMYIILFIYYINPTRYDLWVRMTWRKESSTALLRTKSIQTTFFPLEFSELTCFHTFSLVHQFFQLFPFSIVYCVQKGKTLEQLLGSKFYIYKSNPNQSKCKLLSWWLIIWPKFSLISKKKSKLESTF